MEVTLQQMARLALGTPEMSDVSTAILHRLIDILLKKLNCQNEVVIVHGTEAQCFEQLMKTRTTAPLLINDDNVKDITKSYDKINNLGERIEKIEEKLEKHLDDIRKCNETYLKDDFFKWVAWERYADPCEDSCSFTDPDNEIACKLIQNVDFIKSIMRRIARPFVERMFIIEDKVNALNEQMSLYLERSIKILNRLDVLDGCIIQIEEMRKKVDGVVTEFIEAMREIQDMLDCKLDKCHLPPLKKYIEERFEKLEGVVKGMLEKSTCPRVAGFIMNGLQCLSCGNQKVGSNLDASSLPMLPDVTAKNPFPIKKSCDCADVDKPDQKDGVNACTQLMNPSAIIDVYSKESKAKGRPFRDPLVNSKANCNQFFTGKNGTLYRRERKRDLNLSL